MKKLLLTIMMMVLATTVVFAAPNDNAQENQTIEQIRAMNQTMNGTGPVMTQNGTQVHAGLTNALTHVTNENARAALQRNMERFMQRYQARLNQSNITDVDVNEETGETVIETQKRVKYFGFINGKAKEQFEIKSNGQINEKKPWYRFMYTG